MFIQPMLLEKIEKPFDDARYIFEPKIDGHRLLLTLTNGVVQLYTRHGNDVTKQYPELHNVPVNCPDIVLDGEVAYTNPTTGAIEFETVMERFRLNKAPKIREAMKRLPVQYYVFDVLSVNNKDVRGKTFLERRSILNEVLTENNYYRKVLQVDGTGVALFETIKDHQLEGIVAKRKDSRYVSRRSSNWQKIINYQYAEVVIAGYRKNQFGWLAHYEGQSVGIIELAVPTAHKKAFFNVAKSIVTGEDRDYVYLQPQIKAKVRFRNWYKSGMLRTPEFVDFVL